MAYQGATYAVVQALYGIRPVRSVAEVEKVDVRPLWRHLMALSTDPGDGGLALERMAERAIEHGVRPERVEF